MNSMRLHSHPLSGHAHRAELFLSILRLPFEVVDVDLRAPRPPDLLQKNPLGQVPVLEDGDVVIADSNAILVYLARRYDESGRWYPQDPVSAAQIQRWLSIAAGMIASGPAAARLVRLFGADLDYARALAITERIFRYLEDHLANRPWLVGETPTIAEMALYSYTARAPDGGIDLSPYPRIRDWLGRIEQLDGFAPMRGVPRTG